MLLKLEKWLLWFVLDGGDGIVGGFLVWICLYCKSFDWGGGILVSFRVLFWLRLDSFLIKFWNLYKDDKIWEENKRKVLLF